MEHITVATALYMVQGREEKSEYGCKKKKIISQQQNNAQTAENLLMAHTM